MGMTKTSCCRPFPMDISMTNHDPGIWAIVKIEVFARSAFLASFIACIFAFIFNLASSLGLPCFCNAGVKRVGLMRRELTLSARPASRKSWSFQPKIIYQHLICGTQAHVNIREHQPSVSKSLHIFLNSWILFVIFCLEKPTENPWNLRPISDGEKATGVGLGSFTRLIRGVKIDCWGSFPVSMWMKLWNPKK